MATKNGKKAVVRARKRRKRPKRSRIVLTVDFTRNSTEAKQALKEVLKIAREVKEKFLELRRD